MHRVCLQLAHTPKERLQIQIKWQRARQMISSLPGMLWRVIWRGWQLIMVWFVKVIQGHPYDLCCSILRFYPEGCYWGYRLEGKTDSAETPGDCFYQQHMITISRGRLRFQGAECFINFHCDGPYFGLEHQSFLLSLLVDNIISGYHPFHWASLFLVASPNAFMSSLL